MARMNKRVDHENLFPRSKGRVGKVHSFSRKYFWNNIGCMFSALSFGIGGQRLWDNVEVVNISGRVGKRSRRDGVRVL